MSVGEKMGVLLALATASWFAVISVALLTANLF